MIDWECKHCDQLNEYTERECKRCENGRIPEAIAGLEEHKEAQLRGEIPKIVGDMDDFAVLVGFLLWRVTELEKLVEANFNAEHERGAAERLSLKGQGALFGHD